MTSTFILAQGEEFIQCPYNTSHQITNARLLTHLEKCRKAYLKDLTVEGRRKVMKICRHNALHHVPAPELNFHETRCTDAFSVVRHIAYHNSDEGNRRYKDRHKQESAEWTDMPKNGRHHNSSNSSRRHSSSSWNKPEPEVRPIMANSWGLEEEDWETECSSSAGYDPEIKLKTELVMYNPAGLTKSERKLFRTEVRQKAAEMHMKGEPVELPTTSTFDAKPNIADLRIKEAKAERSPPEPCEIGDDSNYGSGERSRTNNHRRYSEVRQKSNDHRCPLSSGDRRNSHDHDHRQISNRYRDPLSSEDRSNSLSRQRRLSSSSSSRHHSSSNSISRYSRSNSYRANRFEIEKEEFYSDDFRGVDPYADT